MIELETSILIATVGNPHGGDDALGPCVAQRLLAHPIDGCQVIEFGDDLSTLIDHLPELDVLIIVDAAVDPTFVSLGRLFDMRARKVLKRLSFPHTPLSSHGLSLEQVIALAIELEMLPHIARIIGLVTDGKHRIGRPTPTVRYAVPAIIRRIKKQVARYRTLNNSVNSA